MFPERTNPAETWPLPHLIAVLLKQFKRPLAAHGVPITEAEAEAAAAAIVARQPLSGQMEAVRAALAAIVAESETVLRQWQLSFRQALATGMDALPGWESTAEFLDIANEKINAESRIGAGAALLALFGDLRHTDYLFDLIEHDPEEVEAVIARRVLLFLSGVDANTPDWLADVRRWRDSQK